MVRPIWLSRLSTSNSGKQPLYRPTLICLEDRLVPAVISVTGVGDTIAVDGVVTLREAITSANNNADVNADVAAAGAYGADTIQFNIPGTGVQTIIPATTLPQITDTVAIDGGNGGVPTNRVQISGGGTLNVGFDIEGPSNVEIRNLVINGFTSEEILVIFGSGHVFQGNLLGVDPTGATADVNSGDGIAIVAASNVQIGGNTAAARNVITGINRQGIVIDRSGATIQGNFIGLDATGTVHLGSLFFGITLANGGATIGGTNAGEGNVIVARGGIEFGGNPALGHSTGAVQGNFIGTDVTGRVALNLGNGFGINVNHATGVVINGGNVISGNGDGIDISSSGVSGASSSNITVQGNFIGTAADGVTALGNTGNGISIGSAPNSLVGGVNRGEGNVIAFNGQAGVLIGVNISGIGTGAAVLGNSIFANGKLGIDIGGGLQDSNGVTSNDAGEADTLQNFPVITAVSSSGGNTTITGTLNSTPNSTFRIELFASNAADASSFGEGQRLLGSLTTNPTDGSGNVSFSVTLPGVTVGATEFVTATATSLVAGNPSDTSEFSEINADLVLAQTAPDNGSIGRNLTYTLTVTNQGPFPAGNIVISDLLPSGVTFVSAQFTRGTGSATQSNGSVMATLNGTLAVGDTAVVEIVVSPTAAGSITNQASVAAQVLDAQNQVIAHENDPTAGNNAATSVTTIGNVTTGQITVTGLPLTGFERTSFSGNVATLTDTLPGVTAADFTITIQWGDGQSSAGTAVAAQGGFTVQGSHTYLDEGRFTVTIQVSDSAADTGTATSPMTMLEELLPGGVRGTPNQRYVSELYRDMLRRAVEPAGLAFWSGMLEHGVSRVDVAFGITQSEEYRRGVVQDLYQQYLHRAADATGLHAFVSFLANGGTQEQLAALLVSSPEYNQARAHGTDDGFLDAVFHDGLNRSIDDTGRREFSAQLGRGRSRQAVAEQIFASAEFQLDLVKSIYVRYLDRVLDSSGKATWTHFETLGASDDSVLAHILGEPVGHEFFDKTLP